MNLPLTVRLLAVPVVAAVVVAGIWVTGGLVTNDFAVAMWLTTGWMALAGLACLAIAVRSRALRLPVLAGYAVTAAAAGAYLGSSVIFDDVVHEQVAVAAPAPAAMDVGGAAARPATARNVLLRSGRFEAVRHAARGQASVIRLANGRRVLTLTGFEVDNGPDLRVYLVAGPATTEDEVDAPIDLGALKGNKGDQQYAIPERARTDRLTTAVIWCRAFSVLFARAPLQR
ncbi:MAG TPA: DM13 domain-containing protein [Solirubrobacteraceae bacterium]|nr:DM13 domain-containing protein [Solirubrobacteraceae bacterium]